MNSEYKVSYMHSLGDKITSINFFYPIEKVLFNGYPFYMSYIQEFGFIGAISRLNMIYQWGSRKDASN